MHEKPPLETDSFLQNGGDKKESIPSRGFLNQNYND